MRKQCPSCNSEAGTNTGKCEYCRMFALGSAQARPLVGPVLAAVLGLFVGVVGTLALSSPRVGPLLQKHLGRLPLARLAFLEAPPEKSYPDFNEAEIPQRRFAFTGMRVGKKRPYEISDAETGKVRWKELMTGYANPAYRRSGHLLSHPWFNEVSIVGDGVLSMFDNRDIRQDNGRSVTFETVEPVFDQDTQGFELEGSFAMLRAHRGTGCAYATVTLTDGSNTVSVMRGYDKYGKGYDYGATLVVNGERLYDFAHDDLVQPPGVTTLSYCIRYDDGVLTYRVNRAEVLKKKIVFPIDESKARLRLYGHRWNWKGPLDVKFQDRKSVV